jgi:hypothetical protein
MICGIATKIFYAFEISSLMIWRAQPVPGHFLVYVVLLTNAVLK